MKIKHRWHSTRFGQLACFLGSVELAVPVMTFVAIALAWGTYLESTAGAKVSRATVYSSWWFITLMALICISLIFAVITRYPWRRRHVGFITVHASMIVTILGGFWSLFGRIEGQMPIQTGTELGVLSMDQEQIEVLHHSTGAMETAAVVEIDHRTTVARAGNLEMRIVGRWVNTEEETYVADDGTRPLRAVEISTNAHHPSAWIGESSADAAPAQVYGIGVRVLAAGEAFEPTPVAEAAVQGHHFILDEQIFPISDAGPEALPGWRIVSMRSFQRALVTSAGMVEAEQSHDNPALEVVITDDQGSVEQHRAFAAFPDMIMVRQLEGAARSSARLQMKREEQSGDVLVVHGTPPALRVTYARANGSHQEFAHDGALPWSFEIDGRRITILNHYTSARAATRTVEAPKAEGNRPALLVRLAGDPAGEEIVLPWRGHVPIARGSSSTILRYGPKMHELPFVIRLEEFRKVDYPGTEMAMSYESDVLVTLPDGEQQTARVYMNNPFKYGGWKVYQSGFMGTDVSIFSVMRDPGLPLTYLGCTGLCIGIMITFYSRAYSSGHPGIPVPFARKEQRNVARPDDRDDVDSLPSSTGESEPGRLDPAAGIAAGAGLGSGHAPGHLREAPRGAAHGSLEMVG
jgi:hypothetical protein